MTFEERILPVLDRLCRKLLDRRAYSAVENLANFMTALASGQWQNLPTDEQLFWIERVSGLCGSRALGESWDDPDLSLTSELLYHQKKALS